MLSAVLLNCLCVCLCMCVCVCVCVSVHLLSNFFTLKGCTVSCPVLLSKIRVFVVASPDVFFSLALFPFLVKIISQISFFLKCYGTHPVALLLPLVLVTQYLYVRYMYGTSLLDVNNVPHRTMLKKLNTVLLYTVF